MKPTTKIQTTVAIYARVSTRDKGQEVENQLIALREFSGKQGWTIAHEYIDHEKGGTSKRPQFERMFQDAAERKFDILLFWSLDRFSREGVLATLQHLQRLTGNGIDWWSFKEEYLRSVGNFRDAVLSILATIAKQESIRISERTKAGLERARAAGHYAGRPSKPVDMKRARAMRRRGSSLREIGLELGASPATILHRLAGVK